MLYTQKTDSFLCLLGGTFFGNTSTVPQYILNSLVKVCTILS